MLPPPPAASFASDNASGVHPDVLAALVAANHGSAVAYGDDPWTRRASARFAELFGREVAVLLCWGGTGANVVGLQCLLAPYEAVICPETAHINVDECGAPERFTGAKLIALPTPDGKLRPEQVTAQIHALGDEHHVQPKVVSITQSTELGTLYRPDEVAALAAEAHRHGMLVHLDGARLANAAAALGGDVRSFTTEAGVDALSFGGTKDGMMYGEAVVFLRPELGDAGRFVRKQAGQLPSKMRFVAAQFEALLTDDLWLRNGAHANAMAARLAGRLDVAGVPLSRRPEVNSVFAVLPPAAIPELQAWSFFYVWDQPASEVRFMTAFDTTEDDVDRFAAGVAAVVARHG
ncbi:MAG: aminotransferase class V-fold PLP-dependent enzyme [Acidimicrobiales bacterium]|nr:aminotransferase class V-fold PLP-dependent enzyme [Acidimicrobiales bacterium]